MRSILTVILTLLSSTFVSSIFAESGTRIGVILPLSGDEAFWGENPKNAIEFALEDLKSQEGIDNVRFIFEDDRCSPRDAVAAFHKLVERDKVKIIFGPACSSSAAALVPLAEKAGVLLITFVESDDVRTGPYVLRLWVPNGQQGRRLAEYVFLSKLRSVSILSIQNSYGIALSRAFKERFVALGGSVVSQEEYLPSTQSFRPELTRLIADKPDAFLFVSYIKDGSTIVREAKQLGLSVPFFGPSTINSPDFFALTKGLAEGLIIADLIDSSTEHFKIRWQRRFKSEYPGVQSGAPLFYDATTLLGRWLQSNKEAKAAADYLRSVDYSGVSGQFKFTKEGNLDRQHSLFRINGGKTELILN